MKSPLFLIITLISFDLLYIFSHNVLGFPIVFELSKEREEGRPPSPSPKFQYNILDLWNHKFLIYLQLINEGVGAPFVCSKTILRMVNYKSRTKPGNWHNLVLI